MLGVHLLSVERILVVPHTRCAMASTTEEELHERVAASAGRDASWQPFHVVEDQLAALAEDVAPGALPPADPRARQGRRLPLRRRHRDPHPTRVIGIEPSRPAARIYVGAPHLLDPWDRHGRSRPAGGESTRDAAREGVAARVVAPVRRRGSRASGRLVLISGEAGVGKSSLVEELQHRLPDATWAWGACDGLFTPRPSRRCTTSPARSAATLLDAVRDGVAPRASLRRGPALALAAPRGWSVLVIEDVQWADEATLDLLRFLGRRLRDLPVLLVVTFRDDALAPADPLRVALGELAGQRFTRRIDLPPLTAAGVRRLAEGTSYSPDELYELTGGNPFFVVEVLSEPRHRGAGVRAGRRPRAGRPAQRRGPGGAGPRLARRAGGSTRSWSPTRATSPSRPSTSWSRRDCSRPTATPCASATSSPAARSSPRSRRTGDWPDTRPCSTALTERRLRRRGAPGLPRRGGRRRRPGPSARAVAARRAAELGAHREAAAQYERALRFPPTTRSRARRAVRRLRRRARPASTAGRAAAEAREQAIDALARARRRTPRGARPRQAVARSCWRLCRGPESVAAEERAIELLEPLGDDPELARALLRRTPSTTWSDDPEAGRGDAGARRGDGRAARRRRPCAATC